MYFFINYINELNISVQKIDLLNKLDRNFPRNV